MTDDILSGFGPGSSQPQAGRASSGGAQRAKDLPYATPQGPNWPGEGHRDNYGVSNQPVCRGPESGRPGLGGTNHGNSGTQQKG